MEVIKKIREKQKKERIKLKLKNGESIMVKFISEVILKGILKKSQGLNYKIVHGSGKHAITMILPKRREVIEKIEVSAEE